jgi:hypothetical protein
MNAYAIFLVCFWDRWRCCSFFNFETETNGTTLSCRRAIGEGRNSKIKKVDQAKRWVQFTAR